MLTLCEPVSNDRACNIFSGFVNLVKHEMINQLKISASAKLVAPFGSDFLPKVARAATNFKSGQPEGYSNISSRSMRVAVHDMSAGAHTWIMGMDTHVSDRRRLGC